MLVAKAETNPATVAGSTGHSDLAVEAPSWFEAKRYEEIIAREQIVGELPRHDFARRQARQKACQVTIELFKA